MKLTAKQHENIPRYPSLKQMLDWERGKKNIKFFAKRAFLIMKIGMEVDDMSFYSKRFKKK